MDAIAITAIIAGCSALLVAVLTHVKHSECWGLNITTTQSSTPVLKHFPELVNNQTSTEIIQESRPPSPAILIMPSKPTISAPIPIPSTPLITRANFL